MTPPQTICLETRCPESPGENQNTVAVAEFPFLQPPVSLPEPRRWPLVVMLVLTQWAVGMLLVERLLSLGFLANFEYWLWEPTQARIVTGAMILAVVGFAIGRFDRHVLGLPANPLQVRRISWARWESVAFAIFLTGGSLYTACLNGLQKLGDPLFVVDLLGWLTAGSGLAAIAACGMVYVSTQRAAWSASRVLVQFGCSTLLLTLTSGLIAVDLTRVHVIDLRYSSVAALGACLFLGALALVACYRLLDRGRLFRRRTSSQLLSALTQAEGQGSVSGRLAWALKVRTALGCLSGLVFLLIVASQNRFSGMGPADSFMLAQTALVLVVLLVRLSAETVEHYLFLAMAR